MIVSSRGGQAKTQWQFNNRIWSLSQYVIICGPLTRASYVAGKSPRHKIAYRLAWVSGIIPLNGGVRVAHCVAGSHRAIKHLMYTSSRCVKWLHSDMLRQVSSQANLSGLGQFAVWWYHEKLGKRNHVTM